MSKFSVSGIWKRWRESYPKDVFSGRGEEHQADSSKYLSSKIRLAHFSSVMPFLLVKWPICFGSAWYTRPPLVSVTWFSTVEFIFFIKLLLYIGCKLAAKLMLIFSCYVFSLLSEVGSSINLGSLLYHSSQETHSPFPSLPNGGSVWTYFFNAIKVKV